MRDDGSEGSEFLVRNMTTGKSWWYDANNVRRLEGLEHADVSHLRLAGDKESFFAWMLALFAQFLNSAEEYERMEVEARSQVSAFEKRCIQEATDEIDKLRGKFNWPKMSQRPRPPDGVPELTIHRPASDESKALKTYNRSFAQLGTKSGAFWQRGFTIKFAQDAGIDWGALTKQW